MSRGVDLTGRQFGKLTAIKRLGFDKKQRRALWECKCDCGNVKTVSSKNLLNNYSKSCGCLAKPDLVGDRFGRLVVIRSLGQYKTSRMSKWFCQCDCGGVTVTGIGNLRNGHTKSCGCLSRTQDGNGRSVEIATWHKMMRRCYDESNCSYHLYGARGISVCQRWWNPKLFMKDMGLKGDGSLSIERLDNNGNYEPGNCVWATSKTQCRNRRTNFIVEYLGEKKCLAEWCELLNLNYPKTYFRLRRYGWSPERAFSE